MDLRYVHEFVTLVETGNYLKAADSLFIAQSALSRHIQSLEKELGVKLINRSTRHIELSEYGEIFFPYAQELLRIEYQYTTAFYNKMNNIRGSLTIGSLPVMAPYHISDILAKFGHDNKNFTIHVTQDDDIEQLRNGTADFIFFRETGKSFPDITMMPFNKDSIAAIMPTDHPYAGNKTITLEQLKDEHFLLLPQNTHMYDLCVASCRKAGFEPMIFFTGPNAENIIAMVHDHMGIGLLTKKPILYHKYENIAIVDIVPSIETSISLAYLKNKKMSVAATHFINCVKAFAVD